MRASPSSPWRDRRHGQRLLGRQQCASQSPCRWTQFPVCVYVCRRIHHLVTMKGPPHWLCFVKRISLKMEFALTYPNIQYVIHFGILYRNKDNIDCPPRRASPAQFETLQAQLYRSPMYSIDTYSIYIYIVKCHG